MTRFLSLVIAVICGVVSYAQQVSDPVVMVINGHPVLRSEFEYSYNKNNTENVIDKKTVDEYVELFVNYKLKVEAALDARIDTMSSFKEEFNTYRNIQIRSTVVSDADMLREAQAIYDQTAENVGDKGLIRPAQIFLRLGQHATAEQQARVKARIDSIYTALRNGADFAETAARCSEETRSARQGGMLPWLAPNQTLVEFEREAFALQPGQMSKPFLSPMGYHIVLMKERKQLEPFDSLKTDILEFLERRGIRENIVDGKLSEMASRGGENVTQEQVLDHLADSLQKVDPEMRNLIREYHDGLLLYEISNREVWERAASDEQGLDQYFKRNRKQYAWTTPRYKGIAYHTRDKADVKAVRKSVKRVAFSDWAETLRQTFNADSVIRIRVEKGVFKPGDNALVDREVFKRDTIVKPVKDFPYEAVYGKLLKKGPEDYTDVRGLVVNDYQEELERQWVSALRRKYPVTVYQDVVRTINHH